MTRTALTTIQFQIQEKEEINELAKAHEPSLSPRQFVMLMLAEWKRTHKI